VRRRFAVARLLLATLEIIALTGYFFYTLAVQSFSIGNFFAYFTVQSAMATVLVLITAGVIALRRPQDPAWLDMARAMITTYVLLSGVVYALIVWQAAGANYSIGVPWSSQLLHFWIPALALIDWFVDPSKARVPWRYLGWVIVFPVIWLIVTLVRGPRVGWYPYFFLDSRQVSGPAETVFYCALIVVLITGIAALLISITRMKRIPRHLRPPWSAGDREPPPAAAPEPEPEPELEVDLVGGAERLERA